MKQPDNEAPGRLGAAMEQRRLQLRLKWNQVAERAGMSIAHLSRVRKGDAPPSPLAAASIETALEWPAGMVQRIVSEGLEPAQPEAADALPADFADIEDSSPGAKAMMQAIAAMQEEIRQLREKVEDLQGDRGDGEKIRGRKGA